MEKKKKLIEVMKSNPSLAPIARLADLTAIAQGIANEAEEIGNELSQFALKAEINKDNVAALEAWEDLCDFYKNGARDFAAKVNEAIEATRLGELGDQMQDYNNRVFNSMLEMYQNDPKFRKAIKDELRRRKENTQNDASGDA